MSKTLMPEENNNQQYFKFPTSQPFLKTLETVLQVDEYVATISPGNMMKKVTLKEGTMQEEVFFDGLEGGKIEYTITGLTIITGEL